MTTSLKPGVLTQYPCQSKVLKATLATSPSLKRNSNFDMYKVIAPPVLNSLPLSTCSKTNMVLELTLVQNQ